MKNYVSTFGRITGDQFRDVMDTDNYTANRRWFRYLAVSFDRRWWAFTWHTDCWYGLFRNRPEVIPGRWGFYFFGIEVGSRNPGDKVGVWLKRNGLWPW